MKNTILVLITMMAFSINLDAQRSSKKKSGKERTEKTTTETKSTDSQRSQKPVSDSPRADRKIAITSESGLKSMVGIGLTGTYYITPNIAVDAGAGVGFAGLKAGVRGRYLFSKKKFSPYVGLGLYSSGSSNNNLEFPSIDDPDFTYSINLERSTFAQFIGGFEVMGKRGFVFGLNLGYAHNFNDNPWSANTAVDPDTVTFYDLLFGGGIATGLNIGYAF